MLFGFADSNLLLPMCICGRAFEARCLAGPLRHGKDETMSTHIRYTSESDQHLDDGGLQQCNARSKVCLNGHHTASTSPPQPARTSACDYELVYSLCTSVCPGSDARVDSLPCKLLIKVLMPPNKSPGPPQVQFLPIWVHAKPSGACQPMHAWCRRTSA